MPSKIGCQSEQSSLRGFRCRKQHEERRNTGIPERADLGPYSARSLYLHRWLGQNFFRYEMLEEEHYDRAHFAVDDH